ncbi:MAG: PhnD/SsuA/transferrin family substrate-binding protein [Pseudomonadota bacterium]
MRLIGVLLALSLCCAAAADHTANVMRVGGYTKAMFEADRLDIEITTGLLFNELLREIDESADIHVYDTYSEMLAGYKNGQLDAAFCILIECEELMAHSSDHDFFTTITNGSPYDRYVLLTRNDPRDESANTLASLRGKRLSVIGSHSTGMLLLDRALQASNLPDSASFFADVVAPASSQAAIIDLFFGKTDAALVTRNELSNAAALNPQVNSQLQTVFETGDVLSLVLMVHKDFPEDRAKLLGDMVDKVFSDPKQFPKSDQLVQLFGADSVVRIDPAAVAATMRLTR